MSQLDVLIAEEQENQKEIEDSIFSIELQTYSLVVLFLYVALLIWEEAVSKLTKI